jgi:hypothetical protein
MYVVNKISQRLSTFLTFFLESTKIFFEEGKLAHVNWESTKILYDNNYKNNCFRLTIYIFKGVNILSIYIKKLIINNNNINNNSILSDNKYINWEFFFCTKKTEFFFVDKLTELLVWIWNKCSLFFSNFWFMKEISEEVQVQFRLVWRGFSRR